MNIRTIVLMAILLSFCSCSEKLKDKDFIGTWTARDGGIIELNSNGKFSARNIDFSKVEYDRSEFQNKRLNFEGEWNLDVKQKRIDLISESTYADYGIENTYLYNGAKKSHKVGMSFDIDGAGIFQNKPPWTLVILIGDPDDMNKYQFEKFK